MDLATLPRDIGPRTRSLDHSKVVWRIFRSFFLGVQSISVKQKYNCPQCMEKKLYIIKFNKFHNIFFFVLKLLAKIDGCDFSWRGLSFENLTKFFGWFLWWFLRGDFLDEFFYIFLFKHCATFDVTHISRAHNDAMRSVLDTVQYFLIKLGIKPRMHLWKISILLLNNVIFIPRKIINKADKSWAHF